MAFTVGQKLGGYEILSLLGAGGFAEVYKARDTRLDRIVAVKVLSQQLSSSPEAGVWFEREAKTIAALHHPYICKLYDIGQHDGLLYLVMEYLQGETLAYRIATEGPLPVLEALPIAKEIALALDTVHRCGLLHRDVKPANIILTESGAKLMDFGVASLRRRPFVEIVDQTKSLVGTIAYMAPEYLNGSDENSNVDIWAFGCTFYEMLAGIKAFGAPTITETVQAILAGRPAPLPPLKFPEETLLNAMMQNSIEDVIKNCMAPVVRRYASDFVRRYSLACEIVDELQRVEELILVTFLGSDGSVLEKFSRGQDQK